MSDLQTNANEVTAELNRYEPYKNETEQVLFRTKMIFRANRLQWILWAACYMLLVHASSDLLIFAARDLPYVVILCLDYFMQLLIPLLFLCLFGWLARLVGGENFAVKGILDPFRWVKAGSLGRFLMIVFTVVLAYFVRGVFAGRIPALVVSIIQPDLQLFTGESQVFSMLMLQQLFTGESPVFAMWMQYPLLNLPVLIMLQWAVDFFCIHAAITRGQAARGAIHSYGVFGKFFRVQIRLAAKFLLIPYVLYFATYTYAPNFLGYAMHTLIYHFFMPCAFLGFGFVYYPQSAIARTLILIQQPRVRLEPAEPADFHEIDDAYRQSLNEDDREDEEDSPADDSGNENGGPGQDSSAQ